MINNKATQYSILIGILVISIFLRFFWLDNSNIGIHPLEAEYGLQALDNSFSFENGNLFALITKGFISILGNTALALHVASGIVGILTIYGLYLLTSSLFHWRVAALTSFILGTSFWHLYYSRVGLEIILVPLISVWSLYFLWEALKKGRLSLAILAGIVAGLGAYTHLSFIAMLLVYGAIIMNYFSFLSKDFVESEYRHGANVLIKSVTGFILAIIVVSSPITIHYIFNSEAILNSSIGLSYSETINNGRASMFLLYGPIVMTWPLAALAMIGLVRELVHWIKRKHGHFATAHTLILSWLVAGLIPGLFARHAPDTFLTFNTIMPLAILAGQALWWIGQKLEAWDDLAMPRMKFKHSAYIGAAIAVIALTIAVGTVEASKYKKLFSETENGFGRYTEISDRINKMPQETNKYVLVNTPDSHIKYIIQYLTDTGTSAKQNEKRTWYISQEDFDRGSYDKKAVIIPLK